jgi:carbamoyl-phosphate synthase small subunit
LVTKGFLVLETGEVYEGVWGGPQQPNFERAGEVVFNTSHQGYEEIATDPSYFSQIVVMTAPMQGNYGADQQVWESRKIWIEGFIALQIQKTEREQSWLQTLIKAEVPAITEMDTRAIALRLRSGGTPWGALVFSTDAAQAKSKAERLIADKKRIESDWVHLASRQQVETLAGEKARGPRIAVLDFGAKENILRELKKRAREVRVFPSRTPAAEIAAYQPDGLVLTNGPGDPAQVKIAPETVRHFVGRIPIYGICMGHQVLALALGASTFKLKFGHRGANHPIQDRLLGRIYMTSQNHGYAVKGETLPKDAQVTQVNLNDQTVAGFYSEKNSYLGIQYHPESHPGPHEATELFDFFVEKMMGVRK